MFAISKVKRNVQIKEFHMYHIIGLRGFYPHGHWWYPVANNRRSECSRRDLTDTCPSESREKPRVQMAGDLQRMGSHHIGRWSCIYPNTLISPPIADGGTVRPEEIDLWEPVRNGQFKVSLCYTLRAKKWTPMNVDLVTSFKDLFRKMLCPVFLSRYSISIRQYW